VCVSFSVYVYLSVHVCLSQFFLCVSVPLCFFLSLCVSLFVQKVNKVLSEPAMRHRNMFPSCLFVFEL